MIAQALVSLLNIGAFRLAPPSPEGGPDAPAGQRDLGRHATRSTPRWPCSSILERSIPQDVAPLRDALSQLQMAYAREAQGAPAQAAAGEKPAGAPAPQPRAGAADEEGPGPAESSGRLWVPGR